MKRSLCWGLLLACAVPLTCEAQVKEVVVKRNQLEIALRTSRTQVPAGSGFGIAAEITNKSQSEIFLAPKYVTIMMPPEFDPGTPRPWWAVVRGVENPDPKQFYETVTRLGPGDKTTAFWAGNTDPEKDLVSQFWSLLNLLTFTPGEYTIKVVALYWPDEASATKKANNYNSEVADIKVVVVAPQWVVIVGSILGGLIAYFLLPGARLRSQKIDLLGIGTAALLSLIVTVLIARVSDTQFLVRISINDFWGAIAIGFIANASGMAVLRRYLGRSSDSQGGADGKGMPDAPPPVTR